ncbi:Ethylene-responsive transcription factor WRI1 [Dichanthelium oligosanthes]|uniref:Ethylene-responsive transcription factor WRI1 n=1 Tax=Dichanthelium oligosanthes TaxID=888268 RepID=A0A1E5VJZ4_9POAL|nr:Ethylene-responsive transcription factor WRI1 [Dichanthelium oligosanthes]
MTKPHCAVTPLSPSSRAASSLSCLSSSASTSGSCYAPASWPPKCTSKKKRSNRRRAKNGAGGAVAVPRRNSSIYRGVTRCVIGQRHRGSGKFEAHLWDRNARSPAKNKKGRQGGFDSEEAAAHAYDLAALKYWGSDCKLNFPLESYKHEQERMQRMTREAYLATLRRRSSCFSRGASGYRGVAKHHHNGRWEARIGYASGKKYLYLGIFGTQEEAARAYDLAALELRGDAAITNFDSSSYTDYLQQHEAPVPKAQPRSDLKPKTEPVDEAPAPLLLPPKAASWNWKTPLLTPKPEPEDELAYPLAPLPPGPVLRDVDDADHAISEILPALCMDPADFEARYPARRARALGWPFDDQLRALPLPDAGCFEDDIETLFEAPGSAGPGQGEAQLPAAAAAVVPDAVSYAAATISSLASGRWW